jgi:putative SOS response-associated peptidase YedK
VWDAGTRNGESIDTRAVVATAANEFLKPWHDRMPAILNEEYFAPWPGAAGS